MNLWITLRALCLVFYEAFFFFPLKAIGFFYLFYMCSSRLQPKLHGKEKGPIRQHPHSPPVTRGFSDEVNLFMYSIRSLQLFAEVRTRSDDILVVTFEIFSVHKTPLIPSRTC